MNPELSELVMAAQHGSEDALLEVRNFGETTLTEVRNKLRDLGLHLGMRLPQVPAGV